MCGIAGFIGSRESLDRQRDWIMAMNKALNHRGPDASDFFISPPAVLGHTRLSIIDLADGSQPMSDPTGRFTVVFNGEIYNFLEIRAELEKKGAVFKTRSDTEVLLTSYIMNGWNFLDDLEGMFALAIWDKRERTLFAARDRMGKKPFYYTVQDGIFAFASELSALEKLDFLDLRVDPKRLSEFLAYKHVVTPRSIYKNVYKLRPGHRLCFCRGEVQTARYWDLPVPSQAPEMSVDDYCDKLRELLRAATKRRLISDVPLGAFLSGGIDSSIIVSLMARECADPVKTFSIGFSEKSYDESPFARIVARACQSDHHEEILSAMSAGSLLPEIVARQDEPLADPSVVPTYLLSQSTRKRVTVALSGDGGDELFGGYEHFLGFKWARRLKKLAPLSTGGLEFLKLVLPNSTGYVSPKHVVNRFLSAVRTPDWLICQEMLKAMSPELQHSLWLAPEERGLAPETIFHETKELYDEFPSSPMDKAYYQFCRQYLLDYILVKVDRCSMMHALEVRSPLLDKDVVEFAFGLPHQLKIKGGKRKFLLKRAFEQILPPGIVNRKKRGFLIPTADWLKQKDLLGDVADELLGPTWLNSQGLFNPKAVAQMRTEHESGKVDRREELWAFLVLQLWLKQHNPVID